MATDDPVLCQIDERGVASITLNRPHVNNAYNGALIDAVIANFDTTVLRFTSNMPAGERP